MLMCKFIVLVIRCITHARFFTHMCVLFVLVYLVLAQLDSAHMRAQMQTSAQFRFVLCITIVTRKEIVWKLTIAYCSECLLTILLDADLTPCIEFKHGGIFRLE